MGGAALSQRMSRSRALSGLFVFDFFCPAGFLSRQRATRVAAAATTTSTTQGGWLLGALLAAAGGATRRSRCS